MWLRPTFKVFNKLHPRLKIVPKCIQLFSNKEVVNNQLQKLKTEMSKKNIFKTLQDTHIDKDIEKRLQ